MLELLLSAGKVRLGPFIDDREEIAAKADLKFFRQDPTVEAVRATATEVDHAGAEADRGHGETPADASAVADESVGEATDTTDSNKQVVPLGFI